LKFLQSLSSKIKYKIGILVVIIIVFIISSFGIVAYFQSQQTLLGNSINIAGKNRFLTANLLFQTSDYMNSGRSANVYDAINKLDTNIKILREGGKIADIELKPLSSKFSDSWLMISNKWTDYKAYIIDRVVNPKHDSLIQQKQPPINGSFSISDPKIYQSARTELESMATGLINSSDNLVKQLGDDAAKNSLNLILLEISFAIMDIGAVLLLLYVVLKMLKPIAALTHATSLVKKGNLDISVEQKGDDEISVLSESFNSMVDSIKGYIVKQNQLTAELKKLNEQLKHKDRLKDEFINIAAHELRTPIQPILGLSEVIRSRSRKAGSDTNKEDEEFLNVIIRNAKRLQSLSTDILDITKIESRSLIVKKELINLHDLILNTIEDYKNQIEKDGKQSEIALLYDNTNYAEKNGLFVQADRARLTQVISNFISNAIEFTQKGTIKVSAFQDHENKQVIVSMNDSGSGIDPEVLPKLFTKFTTKSNKGTGLGLFISKGIIEAHGGRIWAENNPNGDGATFSFSLPLG
jgi:signal transduction histidine kinase